MKVVRHQTIGVEFDFISLARFTKQNKKRSVINRFGKDDSLVVPAVHDVQDAVSGNLASSSGHGLTPSSPLLRQWLCRSNYAERKNEAGSFCRACDDHLTNCVKMKQVPIVAGLAVADGDRPSTPTTQTAMTDARRWLHSGCSAAAAPTMPRSKWPPASRRAPTARACRCDRAPA